MAFLNAAADPAAAPLIAGLNSPPPALPATMSDIEIPPWAPLVCFEEEAELSLSISSLIRSDSLSVFLADSNSCLFCFSVEELSFATD
jgi:hypothetical protein